MITSMPGDWMGLTLLVFFLGVKHGLDPDHLATIDGLARCNAQMRPRLARWSGCLFSLGHGVIVTLVAGIVGAVASEWATPRWLDDLGAWISIAFLMTLGVMNLTAVFTAPRDQPVKITGLKGRWLGGLTRASHPLVITAIGAAFALSFDTLSQTALFSATASKLSGWMFSAFLGVLFMVGMMLTDGLNGLLVGSFAGRSDGRALIASRTLCLAIGCVSLLIAALGVVTYVSPGIAAVVDSARPAIGVGILILMPLSFIVARYLVGSDTRCLVEGKMLPAMAKRKAAAPAGESLR